MLVVRPPTGSQVPHCYNGGGGCDGEEHSQDRQENLTENRRERQTLPLRQVPQEKPETCKNTCPLVLLKLLEVGIDG